MMPESVWFRIIFAVVLCAVGEASVQDEQGAHVSGRTNCPYRNVQKSRSGVRLGWGEYGLGGSIRRRPARRRRDVRLKVGGRP